MKVSTFLPIGKKIVTTNSTLGWFLGGTEPLLDLVGTILEYLQRPDIAKQKSVRLCTQTLTTLRTTVGRLVLFRLSELDDLAADAKQIINFLQRIMYWQTIILSPENTEGEFTRLICYLLYSRLIDHRHQIRLAAADVGINLNTATLPISANENRLCVLSLSKNLPIRL